MVSICLFSTRRVLTLSGKTTSCRTRWNSMPPNKPLSLAQVRALLGRRRKATADEPAPQTTHMLMPPGHRTAAGESASGHGPNQMRSSSTTASSRSWAQARRTGRASSSPARRRSRSPAVATRSSETKRGSHGASSPYRTSSRSRRSRSSARRRRRNVRSPRATSRATGTAARLSSLREGRRRTWCVHVSLGCTVSVLIQLQISISACQDIEKTWDCKKGLTLTQVSMSVLVFVTRPLRPRPRAGDDQIVE